MLTSTRRMSALAALAVGTAAVLAPHSATAATPTAGATSLAAPTVDRTLADARIHESSGLARSAYVQGRLWTHNDSGGGTTIYALDRRGRTSVTYELGTPWFRDWEGMARASRNGVSYLFVGDIGDNGSTRTSIYVNRVREPRPGTPSRTLRTAAFELTYPDGAHNAETVMVRPGTLRIYVVSKVKNGKPGAIYRAPLHPSTKHPNLLRRVAPAPTGIMDGAFLRRGEFVLRGWFRAYVYGSLRDRTPQVVPLPNGGESITASRDSSFVYTGSEGRYSDIWRVPIR